MSGLGLEPRWLLNRLKIIFDIVICDWYTISGHMYKKILPCQVLSKAEDQERVATIEASKVKEEENMKNEGDAIEGASSGEVTRV